MPPNWSSFVRGPVFQLSRCNLCRASFIRSPIFFAFPFCFSRSAVSPCDSVVSFLVRKRGSARSSFVLVFFVLEMQPHVILFVLPRRPRSLLFCKCGLLFQLGWIRVVRTYSKGWRSLNIYNTTAIFSNWLSFCNSITFREFILKLRWTTYKQLCIGIKFALFCLF